MKKVILVDGNNLMFRSYYATAYTGNTMKNSKGFPTNALYGFINMMHKIISEEKPKYIAVAFDIGKNFRLEKYQDYKAGRIEMPEELALQMPIARKILDAMGIPHFELEPYEADDIIGTFARMADEDPEYDATIVSSDKDLLQLISNVVDVKLLKQKGYIRYNPESFYDDYGIAPIRMIDLKALAGDPSDHIPGVKGIGEKTALSLLQQYDTIEAIYEHIDEIKGKMKEKLVTDEAMARLSKDLATIYKEVPLGVTLDDIVYTGEDEDALHDIYEELEFYSFLKNRGTKETKITLDTSYQVLDDVSTLQDISECAFYIECDEVNYHDGHILKVALATKDHNYIVPQEKLGEVISILNEKVCYTFDFKKCWVLFKKCGIDMKDINYDAMIAAYLLDYNVLKDDITYLMRQEGIEIPFYEELYKAKFAVEDLDQIVVSKARYIFDTRDKNINALKLEDMYDLFMDIEMPLISVLAEMEYHGICVKKEILDDMKENLEVKIDLISREIYNMAGVDFNISSPKQLGEVLFDHMHLPYYGKKGDKNYKTDAKMLEKLLDVHPIVSKVLEYRNLTKLYSTYLEGLAGFIKSDGKIHTIYKQNLTRTGRLSSVEPNMQNIPAHDEEGRKVRKAFLPENDFFLSADYSQIELRVLSHISGSKELQDAFIHGADIHTKVASDIFDVPEQGVTKEMRHTAKAVIFGIVYGISGFGLGENLHISSKDAKQFIEKYYELYPGVKRYMDEIVKEAYDQGCVRTLFGRKRNIPELTNKNYMIRAAGERIALNTPIQGTSADIMKKAMVDVAHEMKKHNLKSKMLLQVHDEIVIDVVESEKEIVEQIIKEQMEHVTNLSVPLKVGIDTGKDWYEAK